MGDILTASATASHDSTQGARKYWCVRWGTFDYQLCIVGHTHSSLGADHAAVVARVPLRGIHHAEQSHKPPWVEHFYVLQRRIPYVNALGTENKTILLVILEKK